MGDMGDVWREFKPELTKRKEDRKISNTNQLKSRGIDYKSYNEGYHLVFTCDDVRVDYYPSTDLILYKGFKFRNLNRFLKRRFV